MRLTPLVCLFMLIQQIQANTITIFNHARYPIWVSLYSVNADIWSTSIGPATRPTPVTEIPARAQGTLERPGFSLLVNRELIFSTKSTDLTPTLDCNEYKKAATHPAGWMYGTTYHIAEKDRVLHCYSEVEWEVAKPIIDAADAAIDSMLGELQKNYSNHPYAQTQASLRLTTDLCHEETDAILKRLAVVHSTLENLLSMSITPEKTPRIALCLSGGGLRAAIASYALVAGLADIGLLNAITYCAALSGSTWFLTDWITFGQPLNAYHDHFIKALSRMHPFSIDALSTVLWPKYIFGEDTSIVDLYGVYLANTFFRQIKNTTSRQKVTFSSLGKSIKDGTWPFPLATAAETSVDNHWVTFSPYEISCDTLGFILPTWAFGRKFVSGTSIDYAPEQSLGFFMGLWGSALSGTIQEMLDTEAQELEPLLYHTLSNVMKETGIGDIRFAGIKIHNPLYGLESSSYRARNMRQLVFMDAGYIYNLPLPPLFKKERAIDIIIIMDASQDVHQGTPDFRNAISDLRQQGYPLPTIDFDGLVEKPIHIFSDPTNPQAPILIYIVPVKQDGFDPVFDPAIEFDKTYATSNFSYKQNPIDKLADLIRFTIAANKDSLLSTIQGGIARK